MGQSFYLLLDILSISFPLMATFDRRIAYFKSLKYIIPSILIVATLFISWDVYFTEIGVWGFNSKYLLGVNILNLPIEEWLFFFCIPYACVFIYESVRYFKGGLISSFKSRNISLVLGLCLILFAIIFRNQSYTLWTFLSLGLYILALEFVLKVKWLSHFYLSFLWILIPFFIVNGFLTGTLIEEQVVWYNDHENFGIRLGTIPIEDTFYGMLLIIMNIHFFEWFKKLGSKKKALQS